MAKVVLQMGLYRFIRSLDQYIQGIQSTSLAKKKSLPLSVASYTSVAQRSLAAEAAACGLTSTAAKPPCCAARSLTNSSIHLSTEGGQFPCPCTESRIKSAAAASPTACSTSAGIARTTKLRRVR